MKTGDLVISVNTEFEVFIFLGKGLWKGWIRLYSFKDGKKIQVRDICGGIMKIGDLAEHYTEPHNWGIIIAKCMHQYQILWMDGECSWISKRSMVKKCP